MADLESRYNHVPSAGVDSQLFTGRGLGVGIALAFVSCVALFSAAASTSASHATVSGSSNPFIALPRQSKLASTLALEGRADLDNSLLAKNGNPVQKGPPLIAPPRPYKVSGKTYSPVPILFDTSNDLHRDINEHPEQPARIDACLNALSSLQTGRLQVVDVAPSSPSRFSAEELDHARAMLVQAHTEEYVSKWEERCRSAKEAAFKEGRSPDCCLGYVAKVTYITPETFDLCLRTAAAWIQAVDVAMEKRTAGTMALTRPPGHHATASEPSGFCLFNFAAAAAIHALQKYPEIKVSIFDWDVHYGQGVADIVQRHSRARYVSIHEFGIYPFTETQLDNGEQLEIFGEFNNIMAIPINARLTWPSGYEQVFKEKALPFIRKNGEWDPELVIVCCGFDAMLGEKVAHVSLRATDYGVMMRMLREHLAENRKQPPGLMLGLEGGYNLEKSCEGGNVPDALLETIKALVDDDKEDESSLT